MAVVTAVTGGRMGPRGGIHPNQGLEDYVSASLKPIKGKENLDTPPLSQHLPLQLMRGGPRLTLNSALGPFTTPHSDS